MEDTMSTARVCVEGQCSNEIREGNPDTLVQHTEAVLLSMLGLGKKSKVQLEVDGGKPVTITGDSSQELMKQVRERILS